MAAKSEDANRPLQSRDGMVQHVIPQNNHWIVRSGRRVSPASVHKTQAEAIEAAREIAKNRHSEVIVHSRDGRIKHRVSVSPADELMLRVWESAHESHSKPRKG